MKGQILWGQVFRTMLISAGTLLSVNAQTPDSLAITEEGWIEKMNDKIGLDISFNNSYQTFEVRTPENRFKLYPNTPTNLRLNVNYRFLSFGFQFSPDLLPGNGDEDKKGDTRSFELKTAFIEKHWFADLSYSKVRGYYLQNSDDFPSFMPGGPYIQIPDLHYSSFMSTIGYSGNSKFSLRSLRSQTERQLLSAGSFLPAINLSYYTINDKSTDIGTQKSMNFEASIGPGYTYTFVSDQKFYLSVGAQTSLGYLKTKLTTRESTGNLITHQDNFIFRWDGKLGLGYNGNKLYTGVYTTLSGANYKQQNTTAVNFETRVFYHLFVGIRLPAPSFLERGMQRMEELYQKQGSVKE